MLSVCENLLNKILHVFVKFVFCLCSLFECYILDELFAPWRLKNVRDDIVLITGGGSGIGRLLCLEFARKGCRVVIWDLNIREAQVTAKMVRELGCAAYAFECDVSNVDQVNLVADEVKKQVGTISILVNNAGVVTCGRLNEVSDADIERDFRVNAIAHFWTIRAFLPDMQAANHGHIVTVSSLAGLVGVSQLGQYCASKFAACGISEALAMELQADGYDGLHVTIVCPFFVSTGMFDGVDTGRIGFLTPKYVAEKILESVLLNKSYVVLPKAVGWLVPLKYVLPVRCAAALGDTVGISHCMDTFSRRSKKASSKG